MFRRSFFAMLLAALWAALASPPPVMAASLAHRVTQAATLAVDTARARPLAGFTFERDEVRYRFDEGTLYPVVDVGGNEVGAVFLGDGQLSFEPTHPWLKLRLYRWTWFKDYYHRDFDAGLILYTGKSPFPEGSWGEAGADAAEAAALLESRWAILNAWPDLPDQRDVWAHSRGPNLALDLAQDALAPPSAGMRFIEVNARPPRLGVDKTSPVWATPSRWWMAWYESPRGVQPVARLAKAGVLFTHGQTRAGYVSDIFYAATPPRLQSLEAANVERADHEARVRFDPRMERLYLEQRIAVELAAEGPVTRLNLVPREPKTWGSGRNYLEAFMQVKAVRLPGGAELPFVQRGGEVLIELPEAFAGALEMEVSSDVAMGAGARAESGLFALHSPVGYNYDRVAHTVGIAELTGDQGLKAVISEDEAQLGGEASGSLEPPAIAVGKFTALEIAADETKPLMSYAYTSQIQGRFSGTELAQMMGRDSALILHFLSKVLGPLPTSQLAVVQTERRPAGLGYDPAAPGVNTFMSDAILAGSAGIDSLSNANVGASSSLDGRNTTSAQLSTGSSNQVNALTSMAIMAQAVARQWYGLVVPLADNNADYWVMEGLRVFVAHWAVEILRAGHPSLDQTLNQWIRWAKRSDQPGRQYLLGGDNGWLVHNRGAEAKGYLIYNNLRYAVGDNNMALGLRATFESLRGAPIEAESFQQALQGAFGKDLSPLFDGAISEAKVGGTLEVAYHLEPVGSGTRLTAKANVAKATGPTLGATLRVTFADLKRGVAFIPLDGAFDQTFSQPIKKVEVLERGSGLVGRVALVRADIPVQ